MPKWGFNHSKLGLIHKPWGSKTPDVLVPENRGANVQCEYSGDMIIKSNQTFDGDE